MIHGSCLCGEVKWRTRGALSNMSHCHCSMCRKAHAAAFGTYANAHTEEFDWLSGEATVRSFESSSGFVRSFCASCGSVVPFAVGPDRLAVPVGCVDGDPGVRADAHIFASSAPKWSHVCAGLPSHDAYPDPGSGPNIAREPGDPPREGVLRGSCLCGDVAYEVTTPLKAVHNCHCSRCRKARAAAHTTNGFTDFDGVRFTRGEDLLVTFKLPDARFFSQVFCSRCGSGMPRLDEGRNIAIIPFGSLDDEPALSPQDHIFMGSRAPWYEPTDDLPRFEMGPSQ